MTATVGRPRVHNRDAIMRLACARIAQGRLVQDVAASMGVHRQRIMEWGALPEYADAYARARELQAWAMAEQTVQIADGLDDDAPQRITAMLSALEGVDDDDKERILNSLHATAVQRDRIRVDARKWLTSKIAPRVFADRAADVNVQVNTGPQQWNIGGKVVEF